MPSVSRAQQRLMQAAEHGATFPMARKVRQGMTMQQMHDFAVGSEKGKPQHVRKRLHPALKRHGQLVKEAHQHLTSAVPAYRTAHPHDRMRAIQEHVRTRKANGHG